MFYPISFPVVSWKKRKGREGEKRYREREREREGGEERRGEERIMEHLKTL